MITNQLLMTISSKRVTTKNIEMNSLKTCRIQPIQSLLSCKSILLIRVASWHACIVYEHCTWCSHMQQHVYHVRSYTLLTIASEDIVEVIQPVDIGKCGVLGPRIESSNKEPSILTMEEWHTHTHTQHEHEIRINYIRTCTHLRTYHI